MYRFGVLVVALLALINMALAHWPHLAAQEYVTIVTLVTCLVVTANSSSSRINPASLLCCTVALFLLGRFLLNGASDEFNYRYADWFLSRFVNDDILARALAAVSLFLCGITLGVGKLEDLQPRTEPQLTRFALIAGALLLPFALYRGYVNFIFWQGGDYLQLYLGGGPDGFFYMLGGWLILCIFAFMASKPPKPYAIFAFILGISLCVAETLKGARGIAFAEIIVLTWLLTTTQMFKVPLWKAVLLSVVLIIFADYVGGARSGQVVINWAPSDLFRSVIVFLYSQGVSLFFLTATLENLAAFTLLDGLRATFALFLDNYARIFENLPALQSAEFALASASLPHRIAYIVNPQLYLSGMGMGGSAVAESLLYSAVLGPLIAGSIIGISLRLLCKYAAKSPRGLFILAYTLPFVLLTPRETQLYYLVPFLKASFFIALLWVFMWHEKKHEA